MRDEVCVYIYTNRNKAKFQIIGTVDTSELYTEPLLWEPLNDRFFLCGDVASHLGREAYIQYCRDNNNNNTNTLMEIYIPKYVNEQLLADGSDSTYLAFPSILKLSDEKVLIAYKASTKHMDVEADLDLIVYNPTTKQVVSKTTIDGTVGEAAQNPEIMQMPNGDIVIYLDIQRVTSGGQQRYGVKEIRSTDGGETWNVV